MLAQRSSASDADLASLPAFRYSLLPPTIPFCMSTVIRRPVLPCSRAGPGFPGGAQKRPTAHGDSQTRLPSPKGTAHEPRPLRQQCISAIVEYHTGFELPGATQAIAADPWTCFGPPCPCPLGSHDAHATSLSRRLRFASNHHDAYAT